MKNLIVLTFFIFTAFYLEGCKQPEKDPVSALNSLTKEFGFIGYQHPLQYTNSGTMLGGRPTALAFVAPSSSCFPAEYLKRSYDHSDFNKKYSYLFKGGLGFLTFGNPVVSASLGFSKDYYAEVELSGLTIEYISSIDISDWYVDGMSNTCKEYLDQVGFVIQALSTSNLKISIRNKRGTKIKLDPTAISRYLKIEAGVEWEITDEYSINITTPKYIGYQLGRIRKSDEGLSLYRAMSVVDGKFFFENIGLFSDEVMATAPIVNKSMRSAVDSHSLYQN